MRNTVRLFTLEGGKFLQYLILVARQYTKARVSIRSISFGNPHAGARW